MAKGNFYIDIHTGHLSKKLRAVSTRIRQIADDFDYIEQNYCEKDGQVLGHVETRFGHVLKECSQCGEKYIFPNSEEDHVVPEEE
ncbi:hypothetical protein [Halobacillus karajensis]|uniref:hypothetical protein n=1 Tax=Halobacillus karajensis TaxID=195088 RepID=UPI00045C850E|nr:hypothetical protein [Halobacillus karajensis]CDQ17954.1 hypothetical protein BN982_00194 [Halobacillus karajensis]